MARNRVVRRSFQGRRGSVRQTEWFGEVFQTGILTLTANTFQILSVLSATGLAKRPFTITRAVGALYVRSDQVAAIESPFGAFGGMVVSDKATTTGATAIPDPVTEVSSDEWFLYFQWFVGGNSTANAGKDWVIFPYDSRGQRKVQDGEDFVYVIANANTGHSVDFVFSGRTLVKLS